MKLRCKDHGMSTKFFLGSGSQTGSSHSDDMSGGLINVKTYAVKEFCRIRAGETERDYEKKIIAEFCIR